MSSFEERMKQLRTQRPVMIPENAMKMRPVYFPCPHCQQEIAIQVVVTEVNAQVLVGTRRKDLKDVKSLLRPS